MIEAALQFKYFDFLIDHLKVTNFIVSDGEGGCYREDGLMSLVGLIESLELKSWFIEYYCEFADLPIDHLFMPVIDDKIIKEACSYMWNYSDRLCKRMFVKKIRVD